MSDYLLCKPKNGQIDRKFALIGFDGFGDKVRVDRSVETKVQIDLIDGPHWKGQQSVSQCHRWRLTWMAISTIVSINTRSKKIRVHFEAGKY